MIKWLSDSLLYTNEFLSSMLTSADWMLKDCWKLEYWKSEFHYLILSNYYWIIDLLKKKLNLLCKKIKIVKILLILLVRIINRS